MGLCKESGPPWFAPMLRGLERDPLEGNWSGLLAVSGQAFDSDAVEWCQHCWPRQRVALNLKVVILSLLAVKGVAY